jgi:hypothetical protein
MEHLTYAYLPSQIVTTAQKVDDLATIMFQNPSHAQLCLAVGDVANNVAATLLATAWLFYPTMPHQLAFSAASTVSTIALTILRAQIET